MVTLTLEIDDEMFKRLVEDLKIDFRLEQMGFNTMSLVDKLLFNTAFFEN